MSMASMQADELRKAVFEQQAMGQIELADMLRDAADTILSLRYRLQELQGMRAGECEFRETDRLTARCPMYQCSDCGEVFECGRGNYRFCPYCGKAVKK